MYQFSFIKSNLFIFFKIVCFTLLIFITLILFLYYQTNMPTIKHYSIINAKVPSSFDNFKIIHLSDLHSRSWDSDLTHLLSNIKKESPDLIVITGDLISINDYPTHTCIPLLESLTQLSPTYYVYGNHEVFMTYDSIQKTFFEEVAQTGVILMNEASVQITSTLGESITLLGISDPIDVNAMPNSVTNMELTNLINSLDSFNLLPTENFNILLAHRPEYLEWYSQLPIDLVLSGHAHGGIVQIPFLGGLYAPNQGVFPIYTSGKHTLNDTTMIISQGIGNSSIPFRLFNRPQVVSLTLSNK